MKIHPFRQLFLSGFALAITAAVAQAAPVGYAYNANGQLFRFDLTNPASVTPIGAAAGASTRALDTRPGTSILYAIEVGTTTSQLLTIDPATGVRTPIGAGFANVDNALNPADFIGFDFNPTTLQGDGSIRIRFVTSSGQNFRLHSGTGLIAVVDGSLAYDDGTAVSATITAAAYTASDTQRVAGPPPTSLYYIDTLNDNLVISGNPNGGTLQLVGPLGVDVDSNVSFDILTSNGQEIGFLVVQVAGSTTYTLHTVDLTTGAASASLGAFPAGFEPVGGFSIVNVADPVLPERATGFGYNATGQLFSFPLNNPANVTTIGSALLPDAKGIDFRPGTLNLYAISVAASGSQLSLIDINSGGATAVGGGFDNLAILPGAYSLSPADQFGFDFNPTTLQVDGSIRIRFVDDDGQNLRLHSDTGAVAAVDGPINIGGVTVTGVAAAAYTNSNSSRLGSEQPGTRLFYLDSDGDRLLTSPNANAGDSVVIGPLGVDVAANTAFDILSFDGGNVGLIAVDAGGTGTYTLHRIDLVSGAAGPAIGTFPAGFTPVNGFSVAVLPAAPVVGDTTAPNVTVRNIRRLKDVRFARRQFRIRGNATDDTAVTQVQVSLRGGVFRPATGTSQWNRTVRLRTGRNVVRVIASDAAGNVSRPARVVIRRARR